MKKILFLYILTSLVSCEPDDICSENTQTTPRLVIEFFDIENFEAPKTAPGLFAVGLDDLGNEVTILGEVVNSRSIIELPLNGSENQTQFKLYSNYDIIDIQVDLDLDFPDEGGFKKNSKLVYVAACLKSMDIYD